MAISNEVLLAHTSMGEDKLLRSWVIPIFCIGEAILTVDGQLLVIRDPCWVMNYPDHSVFLDATTDEVLAIEGPGDGNG